MTSVASIGQIEFAAFPNRVELYKRDSLGCAKCVAKIKRKKNDGWRLVTTKEWKNLGNPHFGHLNDIKSTKSGMKNISGNLGSMLSAWGINYETLMQKSK